MSAKEVGKLDRDINVISDEIRAYQRNIGQAVFEIGRRLKYVKEWVSARYNAGHDLFKQIYKGA